MGRESCFLASSHGSGISVSPAEGRRKNFVELSAQLSTKTVDLKSVARKSEAIAPKRGLCGLEKKLRPDYRVVDKNNK